MTPTQQIIPLIRSFPCLVSKLGEACIDMMLMTGFDSDEFAARFRGASSGEVAAAQFIITVWTWNDETPLGRFTLYGSYASFGNGERAAFAAWAAHPFWP